MTTLDDIDSAPTGARRVRRASSTQSPSAVVMVLPHHFSVNPQTAADNVFQVGPTETDQEVIARRARREVESLASTLRARGVDVHLFDDLRNDRPDAVFPNNWLSTHRGGRIVTYPMFTPNRRAERRHDIVEFLKATYRVQDVIDYSGLEHDGLFLEGTGAMVLDHVGRVAYVARSNRANAVILERFCTHNGFEPMVFDAADESGAAIYHTNVLMCVGTEFALICLDALPDEARRAEVVDRLEETGRTVIPISFAQLHDFAGNAFELTGHHGPILAMSARARETLDVDQIIAIEASCEIVDVDVSTIELAGGSVRCMLAGVHLDPRPT
ncbi:MAG: citrulline utilization hydrolase CtlX [Ilumatobacter sp.]